MNIISHVESYRSAPEDFVHVFQHDQLAAFVVADGAGGVGGGARAAQLVVRAFEDEIGGLSASRATPEMWCEFLLRLDGQIERDSDAGESTAVVVVVRDNEVVGASVGDSEAWVVVRDGNHEVLTSGQHKSRLGSGRANPVGFRATVANSVIIAATDGLFNYAPAEAIRSVLRATPTPENLVALARSRSGKLYDDVGLVIVSVA